MSPTAMVNAVAWKFTMLIIVLLTCDQSILGFSQKGQPKQQLRRSLQAPIDPLPSQPGAQEKVNTKRQQQKDNDDDNDDAQRSSCPDVDTTDVFHCSDPSAEWAIPCDPNSCLWDITKLVPEEQPELCQSITVTDVQAVLPDLVKPCALWGIIFGSAQSPSPAPTIDPSPGPTIGATEAPVQSPAPSKAPAEAITTSSPSEAQQETSFPTMTLITKTPSASPFAEAPTEAKEPYHIPFDTILLNFIIQAPLKTVTNAFNKDGLHMELRLLTEQHALRHVRNVLKDTNASLVSTVVANISTVSLLAPWSNNTVIATHTVLGTVVFHPENGQPRPQAVNNMVHGAFRNLPLQQFLIDFGWANDTTLKRINAVHMGLPSDILPTVATDSETTAQSSKSLRSKTKEALIGWTDNVGWGEWSDKNFVIFAATSGSALLLCLCTCCICRRRQKKIGESSFTELPDKTSRSSDTEPLSPVPFSNGVSTPKFSNNTTVQLGEFPPPDMNSAEREHSNTRETMDSIIAEAFHQSSLAHRSVDAVLMSQMKGVIEDDMESSLSNGSNGRSETTSVYSYIDTKSVMSEDEPNYSFGVAVTTNPTTADDDQSTNWSVAGGNVTGVNNAYGLHSNIQQRYRSQLETPQKMENRIVSTTASTPETSNLMIFCDDKCDDSVSLINDSVILSALDNFNDDFQPRPMPKPKPDAMTTNSRVAAVVASLEARLDGSPESQFSKSWVNYGMAKSPNTSGIAEPNDFPETKSTEPKPDSRSPTGSVSSQRVSEEEDRSSIGSVSLASYAAPAYKNERSLKPSDAMAEDAVTFLNEANMGKPPVYRSQSTGLTEIRDFPEKGRHERGRSASPGHNSLGSQKFADAVSRESNDMFIQQQQESTAKALAFWNKSSGKSSRASQLALDGTRVPGNSPHNEPETFTSLRRTPVKGFADESYQESESDIQSICSYDDRSLFSFAKSKHETEFLRPVGSTPNKERSLLGAQRLPSSSMDGSEEFPVSYQ